MESNVYKSSIVNVIKSLPTGSDSKRLKSIVSKLPWTDAEEETILKTLSQFLLKHGDPIKFSGQCCNPLLLRVLLTLARQLADLSQSSSGAENDALEFHRNFISCLCQLNGRFPDLNKLCSWYVSKYPQVLSIKETQIVEPIKKRPKKSVKKHVKDVGGVAPLLRILYQLLRCNVTNIGVFWDWNCLIPLLEDTQPDIRWLACHCLAKLLKMPEVLLQKSLALRFTSKEIVDFVSRNEDLFTDVRLSELDLPFLNELPDSGVVISDESFCRQVLDEKLGLLTVCGVNLVTDRPVVQDASIISKKSELVLVPSVKRCLRELTLALKSNQPVLLEGMVGCGKTSLVKYVANLMGRNESSTVGNLEIVQLGDQTDSKLMVGLYCCTEIPGEFIWKAGPLTKAMAFGGWLLLEDIDYAPLDVVTLLASVVETRSLIVPGMTTPLKAAPGFQLLATRRLVSYGGTLHATGRPMIRTTQELLTKSWNRILMPAMTASELERVISTRWPNLAKITDRIVGVFNVVSNIPRSQGSRTLSTRDLFKWCDRIAASFTLVTQDAGLSTFLHALDCFCFCIQDQETKLEVAADIGSFLNIPREKTNHCCLRSLPEIKLHGVNSTVQIGRVIHPIMKDISVSFSRSVSRIIFSRTRQASTVLEAVASAVWHNEPVLLVGETGTGKTSIVQYLTHVVGQKLTVINMNQQSDSADLLGGYKPVDFKVCMTPIRLEFEDLFVQTFDAMKNANFLQNIMHCFAVGRWLDLLTLMSHVQKEALTLKLKPSLEGAAPKMTSDELHSRWSDLGEKLNRLKLQLKRVESTLVFSFIPGSLIKALKEGSWILLDEINLAEAETLECLGTILDGLSVNLLENSDEEPIKRHANFRLFACMNPATDVGKKDLPSGIRNRFTEIYMEELNSREELTILCQGYLQNLNLSKPLLDGVVSLYLQLKQAANQTLTDGTGHAPHYSLRTLCRALSYASSNPYQSVQRSLYEAFCLSFLTQLDRSSHPLVQKMIANHILGKSEKSVLKQKLPLPMSPTSKKSPATYLRIEGYWVRKGPNESHFPPHYVLTQTIRRNLADIARIVSAMRFPVLLQGETSVGKTSLIEWLAQATGNVCVRVNNHEHTDLQEYIGNYVADANGKLVFKEGVLVEAMRCGHWIILDELNLAPTEVLEALNRVLDDNRELFITETQTLVKAHPQFLLFATQNPPGLYGGRKVLSRAFRNRFIELHFNEIPSKELEVILEKRCCLPPSYCAKLVKVMLELQLRRRESGVFAGKQGFITLRDLFRWGERYKKAQVPQDLSFYDWDQHIADEGYLLLGGRVRRPEEEQVIIEVLKKHLKRTVNPLALFNPVDIPPSPTTTDILNSTVYSVAGQSMERQIQGQKQKIIWTQNMSRLAVLVGQALRFGEPVLLVGDTGCGKTTICQILAQLTNKDLFTVNCHMHSESADFLGSLRPTRNKTDSEKLFEWADGPLVKSMRDGQMFLADEISLADDSVLERLNSVLEPEGTLLLAEKGNSGDDQPMYIIAAEGFRFLATMNPGGDYGKKELSPALRNRFTEIWCPSIASKIDLQAIVDGNMIRPNDGPVQFGPAMVEFVEWLTISPLAQRCTVTIRDLLSWTQFMNCCVETSAMSVREAYIHGAQMTFIDSLGAGLTSGGTSKEIKLLKDSSLEFLHKQMSLGFDKERKILELKIDKDKFGIEPFFIPQGNKGSPVGFYCFDAPTPNVNAFRLLRAMQLFKPILLEGSPGVGKTALVTSLAKMSGHVVIRINLSEQTDISELFGADLPVEGGQAGQFKWRDGPLLEALKNGHWLLLDELNLASQSVLEGLNACLDHRGEVYIPELDRTFKVPQGETRFFACQNPQTQGGARKGLPRSFLNRFVQVYVEPLTSIDLEIILTSLFPALNFETIRKMVQFSEKLEAATSIENRSELTHFGSNGSPWEFNLRDLIRWAQLLKATRNTSLPGEFVQLVYADRMRSKEDKKQVIELFNSVFKTPASTPAPKLALNGSYLQVGHSFLKRQSAPSLVENDNLITSEKTLILNRQLKPLQSLTKCLEMNWMAILVGPSGTGKTSMVKLLSSLTDHRLSILNVNSEMDTTELLGGFEQADLTRRLGQLWRLTEELVRGKCWELMLRQPPSNDNSNSIQVFQSLLTKWLECGNNQNVTRGVVLNKSKNNSENDNFTIAFLKDLRNLMSVLIKSGMDVQLAEYLDRELANLETEFIRKNNSACDGGKFEWVDSVLVTAVKEGHWLLIDNVNLCSASVLDRLNPLLEPDGVLTITEQGVIDGAIPTVVPHPEFRLILAMDPKNGQISRAMRNRGIEIFLTDDDDEGLENWDTSVLLRSLGLQNQHLAIKGLLTVHKIIESECSMVEAPSLPRLIQAAKLTIANAYQGLPYYHSVLESAKNIYLNQLSVTSEVKLELEIKLENALKSVFTDTDQINQETELSHSLPYFTSGDFKLSSSLSNVRRDGQLLYYLQKLFAVITNQCDHASNSNSISKLSDSLKTLQNMEDFASAIRQTVMMLMETASINDLHLRLKWVQSVLTSFSGLSLNGLISKMASSPIVDKIEEISRTVSKNWEGTIFEDHNLLPLMLTATPQFCRFLTATLSVEEAQKLESLNNRLRLTMTVSQLKWSQSSHCQTACQSRKMGQSASTCLFHTQSLFGEVNTVTVSLRSQRSNTSRSGLIRFFEELEKITLKVAEDLSRPFPSKVANPLNECVWFLNQLWILCDQREHKLLRSDQVLNALKLQWSWINKHALPILIEFCKKTEVKTSDLEIASSQITRELFPTVPEFHKLRNKMAAILPVPEPFRTAESAQAYQTLNSVESQLSWINLLSMKSELEYLNFANARENVTKKMRNALKILHSHPKNALETFNEVKVEMSQIAIKEIPIVKPDYNEDDKKLSSDQYLILDSKAQAQLEILPFQTFLFRGIMADIVNSVFENKLLNNSTITAVLNHPNNSAVVFLPSQLQLAEDLQHCANKQLRKLTIPLLLKYVENLQNSAFNFDFKHLLTLTRQKLEVGVNEQSKLVDLKQPMPLSLMCCLLNVGSSSLSTNECSDDKHSPRCSLPLGVYNEKKLQLKWLKSALWNNTAAIDGTSLLLSEVKNVTYWFRILVLALRKITRNSKIEKIETETDKIKDLTLQQMSDLVVKAGLPGAEYAEFMQTANSAINLLNSYPASHFQLNSKEVETTLGLAWVNVGLLTATFFAPWDSIDPVEKQIHKFEFHKKYLAELSRSLELRDWLSRANMGISLLEINFEDLPKWVQEELERKEHFAMKVASLESKLAYRPDPSQFPQLSSEVKRFFTTLATLSRVNDASFNLSQIKPGICPPRSAQILQEVDVWLQSLVSFYDKITSNFFMYQDLVAPFATGVAQMIHGFKALRRRAFNNYSNFLIQLKSCETFSNLSARLGLFPYINDAIPNPAAFAKELTRPEFLLDMTKAMKLQKPKMNQSESVSRSFQLDEDVPNAIIIIRSALLEILNHTLMLSGFRGSVSASVHEDVFERLNSVFSIFVSFWEQEVETAKLKKEAEDSFYEIRTTQHDGEMSDEDREILEIAENFPSYSEEFSDLHDDGSLIDAELKVKVQKLKKPSSHLDSRELLFLWNVHEKLTKSLDYNNKSVDGTEPNFIEPFVLRYHILSKLINAGGHLLENEPNMLNTHVLASHLTANIELSELKPKKKWNIYHSAYPTESVKCRNVLEGLKDQIYTLLETFPQNPALQRILSVIKRIFGFPISSPLMKLITGLEVVLTVSQDWEKMAHRNISLQTHLSAIALLIIEWRKLELKCWSSTLDSVYEDQYLKTSHWWARLYSLVLTPEKDWDAIVKVLIQFIEDSSVGQFHCRLQLLALFSTHCSQLSKFGHQEMAKKKKTPLDTSCQFETFHWILSNVHGFYSQFLSKIQSHIATIRKPIEEKLKDFVKIAQWNDLNFHRVKAAVEKSHKTIHKHSKEFENVLSQPVKPLLVPQISTDKNTDLNSGNWNLSVSVKDYVISHLEGVKFNEDITPKAISVRPDSPLHNLPSLSKKLSKFANSILKESKVISRVKAFDNSCGSIVANYETLQAMANEIDPNLEKEERKKMVKFHYNLKRKALTDLFKQLSEIGLSYKKGLNVSKNWRAADELKNPILPIVDNFKAEESLGSGILNANQGCEKYLYKSIARLTLLISKLQAPAKEVELGIIHRCSGFSNHLMYLISEKQKELSSVCKTYCRLKHDLSNLKRLSEEYTTQNKDGSGKNLLPPQVTSSNWQNELESLVLRTETTIRHFKCLWDSCPAEVPSGIEPIDINGLSKTRHGDEIWNSVEQRLNYCLNKLKDVKNILGSLPTEKAFLGLSLFTWGDIKNFQKCFGIFKEIRESLGIIIETMMGNGPMRDVVSSCAAIIDRVSLKFEKELEKETKLKAHTPTRTNLRDRSHQTSTNVELLLDSVTRTILLATQAVIKESALDKDSDSADVEDDQDEKLDKKHLTEKLLGFHTKIFHSLRLEEIGNLINKLIKSYVGTIWESNVNPRVVSHLVFFALKSLPLLQQYCNLVSFYFTTAIASHRVCCKFLSILAAIFSNLAQNGFCLPSDLQDEITNEQNQGTKFNEIEDGGLGDGKGSKDISDKIESEDQLEDTLKEGQEKEKQEKPEDDNEENDKSKGIEMSEDFEGEAKDPEKESDTEENESDADDEDEKDKMDKQMGDVENEDSEKIDEKLWGSDSEEEEDLKDEDEPGGGTEQTESEMVAKSDTKETRNDKKQQQQKDEKGEENSDQKEDEINEVDQTDEYDAEHQDPYGKSENQEEEQNDEAMELPEDIKLDMDGTDDQEQEGQEENEEVNDEKDTQGEDANMEEEAMDETLPEDEDDNQDGGEKKAEEKLEQMDSDETTEEKPLSEAVSNTNADTSDAAQSVIQGKGENPSDDHNDIEEDDQSQMEEHGQTENQEQDNGKASTGYGGNSQEGHEGSSQSNVDQSQSDYPKQEARSFSKQTQKERSIGDPNSEEQKRERLKTIDSDDKEKRDSDSTPKHKAELYQHVKENEKSDIETIDLATEEQATETKPFQDDKTKDNDNMSEDMPVNLDDDMDVDKDVPKLHSTGQLNKKPKQPPNDIKNEPNADHDVEEKHSDIYETIGDKIPTLGAQRGPESTIHTRHDLWSASNLLDQRMIELPTIKTEATIPTEEAQKCWRFCDHTVAPLVQELCEQLRLVLEPTKTAKMKGDYRTGKRLNMRKIIPYIASQFRKDKIWLRRTKPSKREYQIAIAVDDSSSMADNQSRQMAFESIALLGKSLSLLEAGDLTILKFGQEVSVVHPLGDPFTDHSGVKILQSFSFLQTKTRVAELVEQSTRFLVSSQTSSKAELTQLFIIVSDGRGVFNEGEEVVKQAIRNAKANGIFIVFVVLDNPTNKDSILDIRMPVFNEGSVTFQTYMEKFPFPFYVILREIKKMPVVLGEALRQWFELVTSSERR